MPFVTTGLAAFPHALTCRVGPLLFPATTAVPLLPGPLQSPPADEPAPRSPLHA